MRGTATTVLRRGLTGIQGMSGANDAAADAAILNGRVDTSDRLHQQASEQRSDEQAAKLKRKSLPERELAFTEEAMGLVFFLPYEGKDTVELSIPVGGTVFVIPFSGSRGRK